MTCQKVGRQFARDFATEHGAASCWTEEEGPVPGLFDVILFLFSFVFFDMALDSSPFLKVGWQRLHHVWIGFSLSWTCLQPGCASKVHSPTERQIWLGYPKSCVVQASCKAQREIEEDPPKCQIPWGFLKIHSCRWGHRKHWFCSTAWQCSKHFDTEDGDGPFITRMWPCVFFWICMSGVLEWPGKPGALITENPLEEAKPTDLQIKWIQTPNASALCLQDCPYTFSDSPAYLRQKKAKMLQPLASCCASSHKRFFRLKMRPKELSNWRARLGIHLTYLPEMMSCTFECTLCTAKMWGCR